MSAAVTPAVTVPPLRANLRGLAIPFGVWVAFRGGRVLCRACQRAARLVPYEVPLPAADALDLIGRPVR